MAEVEATNPSEDQINNNNDNFDQEDEGSQSQDGEHNKPPMAKEEVNNSQDNQDQVDCNRKNESYESNTNDNDTSNNDMDDSNKTNLIVNYLPQQMTDESFEELFKKFGAMKSCKIVRNKGNGYSYGFGFVDFETHEQALKAIDELNGHELENKKIKVAFARPAGRDIKQANLYIKNVPNHWSQDEVKKAFDPFGNIIQVRVLGNNRGIAFVLYDLRKQAEDALDAMNGKTLEGCEAPLEIKFAADKKAEKGSGSKNNNNNNNNNNNGNSNNNGTGSGTGRRERGRRGGRNRDRNGNRQRGGSFFDRQNNNNNNMNNNYNDRQNRGGNQYNSVPYGGGAQYQDNFNRNNPNGVGPVRQGNNRQQRYAPFVPTQQPPAMAPMPVPPQPMIPQMTPNTAYGFPAQQQMIPFSMVPAQQMAPMQTMNQMGQLAQHQMAAMYGAVQMPMGYAPMAQSTMDSIYSVASNNMNNAANMQPQLGQPMTMRNNINTSSNNGNNNINSNDDGVTLFVYNIGPETNEDEMRTMFSPYGQVVKCNVVRKTPGGETKGFGFVTLKDRNQANAAISGMNGSMRNGRTLQVSLKK